ncbi:hypothetical protein F2Q69_00042457 [Brassica cretica]|uniref:Uncharacterized protein n=1 Tax=Brassica cretica TaxID=69181 RepID=A0A8S9NI33_BRACR|nr:hypothetical protein F2Q69_00042457 [Brassica cretica]
MRLLFVLRESSLFSSILLSLDGLLHLKHLLLHLLQLSSELLLIVVVDDNPNPSRKRRTSLSQPSSTAPQPQASSTAPQPQAQSQPTLQHAQCQPTSSNAAPGRGRGRGRHGRPPERGQARKDNGNPNQPKRRKTSLSQPSNRRVTPNLSQAYNAPSSTAPQPATLSQAQSQPTSSNMAPGRGRGRGRRGRPPGRGQARKVVAPRGQGVYMCPFSDRVFECFGSTSREIGGSSSKGSK